MKKWYTAVCDKHKEYMYVMVDSPKESMIHLEERDQYIYTWLQDHCNCDLKLVWKKNQLDDLWEQKYKWMFNTTQEG